MRILVNPDRLHETAQYFRCAGRDLYDLAAHLQMLAYNIDWEIRQKADIEGQIQTLHHQAETLSEQVETLSHYLETKADAFRQADSQGGNVSSELWQFIKEAAATLGVTAVSGANAVLRLGGILTLPITAAMTMLKQENGSVLGVTTVYAANTSPNPMADQALDISRMSLAQRREYLEQANSQIVAYNNRLAELQTLGVSDQVSASDLEQQIAELEHRKVEVGSQAVAWYNKIWFSEQGLKGGFDDSFPDAPWRTRSDDFEDEIQRINDEIAGLKKRLAYQREFEQTVAQLHAVEHTKHTLETSLAEHWWNDVPVQSQKELKYKGEETNYGCTPTATSMVLDYWHNQDPNNKTLSAQELLDINAGQGDFKAKGMSASRIHDEVQSLGYGVVQDYMGSDFKTLRRAVEQGPVIAVVKLNMATSGDNHAIVVTGVSPDGSQVHVNDPWTGQSHIYTQAQFTQSWGTDFGPGTSKNNFLVIRPS